MNASPPRADRPEPRPLQTVGTIMTMDHERYTLLGTDGRPYTSSTPGALGGHRRGRRYGRLDCPSALRSIARGGYVAHRVFFADAATAISAGYRPCAACLPENYRAWRAERALCMEWS